SQRTFFGAMTKAFQPAMAFGFEGDIMVVLRPLVDDGDPEGSDFWTIEIRGRKATAHNRPSTQPDVVIDASLADFLRSASGEIHPAEFLLTHRIRVEGDVFLAARLPDLFGAVTPFETSPLA
ncbi:MAG: sterol transfer family, partial [Acidimicrobiaceae bacterium]